MEDNTEDIVKSILEFKEKLKQHNGGRPRRAILSGKSIYDYELIKRLDELGADIHYYYGDKYEE